MALGKSPITGSRSFLQVFGYFMVADAIVNDLSQGKYTDAVKETGKTAEPDAINNNTSSPARPLPILADGFLRGNVISVFTAGGYSYIKYRYNGIESWVAFIEKDVKVGDIIDFADNPPMVNFESKSLSMVFDKIIFVPEVKIVDRDRSLFSSTESYYRFLLKQLDYRNLDFTLNLYSQAISEMPDNDFLYYRRGESIWLNRPYIENSKITNFCNIALNDLSSAIKINNKVAIYYYIRADILGGPFCKINDYDKALLDYDMAIKLNKNDASSQLNKGKIYLKIKEYGKAFDCARKARAINGKTNGINEFYVEYFLDTGNLKSALEYYKKHFVKNDDNYSLYRIREIFYRDKKYAEALKFYSDLIRIKHGNKYAYYNRAMILIELTKYKEAIADLTKVIEIDPDDKDYHAMRGHAYLAIGKQKEALCDYNTACSKGDTGSCSQAKEVAADISRGKDWVEIGSSGTHLHFMNTAKIKRGKNNTAIVWVRDEVKDNDKLAQDENKNNYYEECFSRQSHMIVKWNIYCKDEKYTALDFNCYDASGNNFKSWSNDKAEPQSLIPDTIAYAIFEKACKVNQKSNNKK